MPNIDFVREEVSQQLRKWTLVRDCISGQEQVKSKGDTYLPRPNAADTSNENKARFNAYLQRAVFYNVTANTVNGLVGQVFSADPVAEVPNDMDAVINDADGAGVSMAQLAKKTVSETLAFGRCGLLTDFPKAKPDGTPWTREEIQAGYARPTITEYPPESIINWRMKLIGSKSVLSLLVLRSVFIAEDDGFELKMDKEWRVLKLDEANLYVIEIWRENKDPGSRTAAPFILHSSHQPTNGSGQRLAYIPFVFVGSLNNNEFPDKPPVYDLAELNIAHYRNSADYEDSVYYVGQPTPVFTGLTKDWVDNVLKGSVQLGSRAAVPLPASADAKLLQATENTMVKEAMEGKERQMVALGAQLVEQKEVQRTLGEAKMEAATTTSVLVQCAKNTGDAITQCLKWAAAFYGNANDDSIKYVLSTDFSITKLPAEERTVLIAEWQGGLITFEEARAQLRQSGIATMDDEAAKVAIEGEMQKRVDMEVAATGGNEGDGNADQNA